MLPYWLLFGYFAIGALVEGMRIRPAPAMPLLALGGVLIAVMIGLRFEVGGDWFAYTRMLQTQPPDLLLVFAGDDPGYRLLNWMAIGLGGQIWLVNLGCGLIFAWGLVKFAATLSRPWLALTIAVPYLVIVVGMGYSRQAVAIGIILAGLAALHRGETVNRFILYVIAATTFHKTAVVILLLLLLRSRRNFFLNVVVIGAVGYLLYSFFLADSMTKLVRNYVDYSYSSQGAITRIAMSLAPSLILLSFHRRMGFEGENYALWRNFAITTLLLGMLLMFTSSSTVVDRLSLYVLPIQMVVLATIPGTLLGSGVGTSCVVAYSATVLFVWLNYAANAPSWLPYRLYPF